MEDPVACSISLNLFLLEMSLSMAERPGQPNGPIKVVFVYAKTQGCIIIGQWCNMLVSYPSEAHILFLLFYFGNQYICSFFFL